MHLITAIISVHTANQNPSLMALLDLAASSTLTLHRSLLTSLQVQPTRPTTRKHSLLFQRLDRLL